MRAGPRRFKARRRWAQNFLVNRGAVNSIVAAFRPRPTDRVLEIGPGQGALTAPLVERVERLVVVEIDPILSRSLGERFDPHLRDGRLEIVQGDVLTYGLRELLLRLGATHRPARLIANLPYNIATAVILRCLEERTLIEDLLVMVQREVAERILSPPGRKSYGGLSVLCQTYARVESILRLRPGSFRPRPKIESQVLRFNLMPISDEFRFEELSALLRAAFEHRRKTLLNNLAPRCPGGVAVAEERIRSAGLDPGCRPEQVSVQGYGKLLLRW